MTAVGSEKPATDMYRVGVDIGGTFTDIVFVSPDGAVITRKVSSTEDDYARAIIEGIGQAITSHVLEDVSIGEMMHGTTVASNAILEMTGARTGLIFFCTDLGAETPFVPVRGCHFGFERECSRNLNLEFQIPNCFNCF